MNAAEQELLDLAILRVLEANRTRFGLTPVAITHLLPQFGFKIEPAQAEERLGYLTDKGMAEEALKVINKANRAWRITTAGIDYVDQRG